jgi:hypothetical protein
MLPYDTCARAWEGVGGIKLFIDYMQRYFDEHTFGSACFSGTCTSSFCAGAGAVSVSFFGDFLDCAVYVKHISASKLYVHKKNKKVCICASGEKNLHQSQRSHIF